MALAGLCRECQDVVWFGGGIGGVWCITDGGGGGLRQLPGRVERISLIV